MTGQRHDPPLKLDMDFDEALGRYTQTDPQQLAESGDKRIHLVRREDDEATFLVYSTDHGASTELRFTGGEPWFTQAQLAQIFGVSIPTVNEHIKNFMDAGELDDSVIRKFRITAADGKQYLTNHYGLDVAFYVGYRVNSALGALFRKWATNVLIQVATKNFYIDKQKLKDPEAPTIIDELRDTIREIRASTVNVYREVRRICSMCQDYDPSSKQAQNFYAGMENKLLWVATSHTASELIMDRASASQPDMGLTFYSGKKGPTQRDAIVGNNYLTASEAKLKNRATVMLLDYYEEQLDQGRLVTMVEAESKMNEFINFNNWPLLNDFGRVKRMFANEHAKKQLAIYKKRLLN